PPASAERDYPIDSASTPVPRPGKSRLDVNPQRERPMSWLKPLCDWWAEWSAYRMPARNLLCCYPPLAALVLVVLFAAWGTFFEEFGAFYLFWHERGLAALLSGVAFSFLLGEIFLVEAMIDRHRAAEQADAFPAPVVVADRYYFWMWFAILVLCIAPT